MTKIISKKENSLFNREEYVIEIDYPKTSTPNKKAIIENVLKLTKAQPDLVSLRKAEPIFGRAASKATVFVYKDKASLTKYEPKHIVERVNPPKKEGEATATPAPAAPAAKPEAKKEEKKPEVKK